MPKTHELFTRVNLALFVVLSGLGPGIPAIITRADGESETFRAVRPSGGGTPVASRSRRAILVSADENHQVARHHTQC